MFTSVPICHKGEALSGLTQRLSKGLHRMSRSVSLRRRPVQALIANDMSFHKASKM